MPDANEWKILRGFAAMLEMQTRQGAPVDIPEGARTVHLTISDTFAQRITMTIRSGEQLITDMAETIEQQREALESLKGQVELLTGPQIILPGGRKH